jgi:hypothetical protein
MKITFALIAVVMMCALLPACKNMEEGTDMAGIQQMKDSVMAHYANVGSIYVDVKDRKDLVVVLGDAVLYGSSADQKAKTANAMGLMALRMFGKDNQLEKGSLVVTKDIKNSVENPTDGITVAINIDSLRKASVPAK